MTPHRKGLMVILDGVGDRPHSLLEGATPLEAAHTPVMDRLASEGSVGVTDPLAPGVPVDTPTGTGLLLGVPPRDVLTLPRGPVEAAGVGLEVAPGDVAIRCNFATVSADGAGLVVRDRRAGRIRRDTDALTEVLQDMDLGDHVYATVRPASQHRAVARLRGGPLSAQVTNTDPGDEAVPGPLAPCLPTDAGDAGAQRTARAVDAMVREAHRRLADHPVNRERVAAGLPPANGLITRGAGLATSIHSLLTTLELSATVVAGERTVVGLSRLLGFETVTRPVFTAMPDTDVDAKVEAALGALTDSDVVFLHVKAADILAHDLDPRGKRDFLTRVDAALAALPLSPDLVLGVCGDHCTDSNTGVHSGDPVPALVRALHWRRDGARAFHEAACAQGGMGRIPAADFLVSFLDAMGAVPEWHPGVMPAPGY